MSSSSQLRVYYLSSGRLGIPVLDALLQDDRISVVGIGSQPDKPCGRKKTLAPTPLAAHAVSLGHEVSKQKTVNNADYLESLRALDIDFLVVASFGQLLKPALLDIPKYGCFNVHASLLPNYRGASPITEAILKGDAQSGVSFMSMDPGLDTGPVYRQLVVGIAADDTTDTLETKLGDLAARHIVDTLCDVASGACQPVAQDDSKKSYARKIAKTDGAIAWNSDAFQLECKIRAYQPWPTAYTTLGTPKGSIRIQIKKAELVILETPAPAGTILTADKDGITVACQTNAIRIRSLVPEGRKEMTAADFLRGFKAPEGTTLKDSLSTLD